MTLARLISEQKRAVLVLIALLCAAGLYAAWQLPIAIFPQTDFPRIVIIVDNGVVPAPQTLVSVTRPIEEAMNGTPGIAHIRSKTSRGASEVASSSTGTLTYDSRFNSYRPASRNSLRRSRRPPRFATSSALPSPSFQSQA